MVAHTFNPSTQEAETDFCEFGGSLVYRVSSRKVRATQRNPKPSQGLALGREVGLVDKVLAMQAKGFEFGTSTSVWS